MDRTQNILIEPMKYAILLKFTLTDLLKNILFVVLFSLEKKFIVEKHYLSGKYHEPHIYQYKLKGKPSCLISCKHSVLFDLFSSAPVLQHEKCVLI